MQFLPRPSISNFVITVHRWSDPLKLTCNFATLSGEKKLRVAKMRVNKYPKAFRQMAVERLASPASVAPAPSYSGDNVIEEINNNGHEYL